MASSVFSKAYVYFQGLLYVCEDLKQEVDDIGAIQCFGDLFIFNNIPIAYASFNTTEVRQRKTIRQLSCQCIDAIYNPDN
jgi:hypothetical protein